MTSYTRPLHFQRCAPASRPSYYTLALSSQVGETGLMKAAYSGQAAAVSELLLLKANVKLRPKVGETCPPSKLVAPDLQLITPRKGTPRASRLMKSQLTRASLRLPDSLTCVDVVAYLKRSSACEVSSLFHFVNPAPARGQQERVLPVSITEEKNAALRA